MLDKAMAEAREGRKARSERDQLVQDVAALHAAAGQTRPDAGAPRAAAVPPEVTAELAALRDKVAAVEQGGASAAVLEERLQLLAAENKELERRLEEANKRVASIKADPVPQGGSRDQEKEKELLTLLMRAEKAEGRVKAVENQLVLNQPKP